MNHKTIKLFGGPQDGCIVEVLHSAHEYVVVAPVGKPMLDSDKSDIEPSHEKFVYKETTRRASNGEVVFSCYDDNLSELR